MVKYIRDIKTGRFSGSIGEGKTNLPTVAQQNSVKHVIDELEAVDVKLQMIVEKFIKQNGRAPIIGADLDGTTADMVSGLRSYVGNLRKIPAEQWKNLFPDPDEYAMWLGKKAWFKDKADFLTHLQASEKAGLYRTLPVYELAPETYARLKKLGFDIKAITAREVIFNADTKHWIRTNNIPIEEVINNGYDKSSVEVDIYLEDAPHIIEQLVAKSRNVVIKSQDYNQMVENQPNTRRVPAWGSPIVKAIGELLERQLT